MLSTPILPVQWAVLLGAALSILVYAIRASSDVQVREVLRREDGLFDEQPAPAQLSDDSITALHVWGSLFFSGAYTLQEHLPEVGDAQRAVAILRLRGRSQIGSTFIQVVERYAQQLHADGGKLMLAGVSEHVMEQLDKTETFESIPQEDVFLGNDTLGRATLDAMAAAERWLAGNPTSEGKE